MNLRIQSATVLCFIIASLLIPESMSAGACRSDLNEKHKSSTSRTGVNNRKKSTVVSKNRVITSSWTTSILKEADTVYKHLQLKEKGLSKKAFVFAWKGYRILRKKGVLLRSDVLSICDFSQSSRRKRLYIIDVEERKILLNTFVAHGRNSGGEFAQKFSNRAESHQSSLGFYITRQTYMGEHGLSLRIEGLERGFNDKANARNIVVHGSDYIGPEFLNNNKFSGRSYGCPAIPFEQSESVIETIKNGSCLFIYHPTEKYLTRSKIINS